MQQSKKIQEQSVCHISKSLHMHCSVLYNCHLENTHCIVLKSDQHSKAKQAKRFKYTLTMTNIFMNGFFCVTCSIHFSNVYAFVDPCCVDIKASFHP